MGVTKLDYIRIVAILAPAICAVWGLVAIVDREAKSSLFCPQTAYATVENPRAFPGETWMRIARPSQLGWDEERLADVHRRARRLGLAALFIVDNGRLISSWGCTKQEWYVASVRKSFMNAVIGHHIAAGRLGLETSLSELGINEVDPPLTEAELQTPLSRLLTSSSGICRPAAAGSNCDQDQASERETSFIYNNWDFNALVGVHGAVSDRDFFNFFEELVARPIGMEGFSAADDGRYEYVAGSRFPAYVMDMSAEDMARFGLLYLNEGVWDGRRILPADWVRASTRAQVSTGYQHGPESYGYLWWVHSGTSAERSGLPPDGYSAEGDWAQAILVLPSRKTVIVVRGYIPGLVVFGTPEVDELRAFFVALLAADRVP